MLALLPVAAAVAAAVAGVVVVGVIVFCAALVAGEFCCPLCAWCEEEVIPAPDIECLDCLSEAVLSLPNKGSNMMYILITAKGTPVMQYAISTTIVLYLGATIEDEGTTLLAAPSLKVFGKVWWPTREADDEEEDGAALPSKRFLT